MQLTLAHISVQPQNPPPLMTDPAQFKGSCLTPSHSIGVQTIALPALRATNTTAKNNSHFILTMFLRRSQ